MIGLQFGLTARFRHVTDPWGEDVIYHFHRQISLIASGLGDIPKRFQKRKKRAAITERYERDKGLPGLETARALANVVWNALFAKQSETALAASERALKLTPGHALDRRKPCARPPLCRQDQSPLLRVQRSRAR
jgi:hypothetical protein